MFPYTLFTINGALGKLKTVLAMVLTAMLLAVAVVWLLAGAGQVYSQVNRSAEVARRPTEPTSRLKIPPEEVGECGYSPALAYQLNQQANRQSPVSSKSSRVTNPPPAISSVFTSQNNFPVAQIVTCGKFRLYYEDFLQGPSGFNDSTTGATRRATLCAVLHYVENTLNVNVNGTTDFIDLYIGQSWSPSNPAPSSVTYLAVAATYYDLASGYGTTAGYYPGNALLHVTTGSDPQIGQYDGTILVDFEKHYSNSIGFAVDYWDDYQNTTATCRFDLFSVLLHEVTHALGFVSNVQEDSNFDAVCGVPNNSFTKFDQLFLYYGSNPCVPGSLAKVVTGTSPSVNPAVSSQTNELRSNRIWLRNGPVEQNHPIYSGSLDPGYYPVIVGSIASHMAASILSFTAMSQYAPGFQPNYVMGPSIGVGQRKREWTLAELRILLSLGYGLNPVFNASTSLNGTDPNGWLLQNNSPAYRTNCSQPMLAYQLFNFMETLPADFLLTNNNTPAQLTASQRAINVSALNVADSQGDAIRVMPNTLFGIRGVSSNANNHAALTVNTSGSQIVYTPEPGFHGRAQFGFYLWDGHERGALRIVTIDVAPGSYVVAPGSQLVVNPGLEDGTEMRQWTLKPNIEHSPWVDNMYEGVFAGQNLSGGHPFNFITNYWNLAGGDIMQDVFYICWFGPNAQNGIFGTIATDWEPSMSFGFNYPIPVTTSGPNERYHVLLNDKNYSTLINQVQGCNVYQFEADVNFERSGVTIGQDFTFQLQFVDNPSPNYHTQLYYTVPVNVLVSTIAHNTWQHVTFTFQYCGTPTYFMNLLVQGVLSNPPPVVSGTGGSSLSNTFPYSSAAALIDNISLKQVSPTPVLTLATTVNPNSATCATNPVTLSVLPVSYVPCNATYVWQPGNLSGNTVTVGPSATTNYALTAASTSCPQTAMSAVTVNVRPTPPAGLVDWWTFDETTGTTAQDIAGSVNNAGVHVNGPTPVPAVVAGGLSFDGVNDYVEVADDPELNFGTCILDVAEPMTIDLWVKTNLPANQLGPNSGLGTILDKRVNPSQPNGYSLFIYGGRLGFQMNGVNYVAPAAGSNYINIADNQWHFIAVSLPMCRGFGSGFLYVDGQSLLSLPRGPGFLNTAKLNIGRRDPVFGSNNYFSGVLDELEIFKNSLSTSDLYVIFAAGSNGKCH